MVLLKLFRKMNLQLKLWLFIFMAPLAAYGAINTFDLLKGNRLDIDNIRIDGNVISSTNTNGNITIDNNGTGKTVLTDLTATTVLFLDADKGIQSSGTTPTELGYVSGVTMAIQTQLDAKIPKSIVTAKGDILVATGSGTIAIFSACPDGQVIEYDSTQSTGLKCSAGGGGTGGTHPVDWEELGNAPIRVIENGYSVYRFESGLAQELYYHIVVPAAYAAGSQIKLNISIYSPGTSNTILISSQSTLVRSEVDDVSTTSNQRTSTNSAITMTADNDNEVQKVELDLTDSSGQINAVAVSPLDIIKIKVYRGSDSDTNDIRMFAKGSVLSWE